MAIIHLCLLMAFNQNMYAPATKRKFILKLRKGEMSHIFFRHSLRNYEFIL
jgi:hypothetical protein